MLLVYICITAHYVLAKLIFNALHRSTFVDSLQLILLIFESLPFLLNPKRLVNRSGLLSINAGEVVPALPIVLRVLIYDITTTLLPRGELVA
jgi:hypothetical protein